MLPHQLTMLHRMNNDQTLHINYTYSFNERTQLSKIHPIKYLNMHIYTCILTTFHSQNMESEFSGNMNIYICTYFVLNTYRVSWYSVKQFHRSCADHNKLYITLYSKYEQNSKFRWTKILKLWCKRNVW